MQSWGTVPLLFLAYYEAKKDEGCKIATFVKKSDIRGRLPVRFINLRRFGPAIAEIAVFVTGQRRRSLPKDT